MANENTPTWTPAVAMAQLLAAAEEIARPKRRVRRRGLRGDTAALDVVELPDGTRRWRYA